MQFDLFDDTTNRIMAATSYDEFRRLLMQSNCQKCALHKGRNNIVVDRGNPQSKVMVIGEGPGEQEDLQAKAFVGKAGQLMDRIFASIEMDTNRDMLIANIVKCRPPGNRAPHTEEVVACIDFLKKQISLVKPRIILLLGATALKHMSPSRNSFSMSDEAGKFISLSEYPGIEFMVLYHPAALLYNAALKPVMWEHIKKFRQHMVSLGKADRKSSRL